MMMKKLLFAIALLSFAGQALAVDYAIDAGQTPSGTTYQTLEALRMVHGTLPDGDRLDCRGGCPF